MEIFIFMLARKQKNIHKFLMSALSRRFESEVVNQMFVQNGNNQKGFIDIKAPALKESSFGTKGDRQTFFDQIFNFCLHNIIARKVLSNFCFGVPSDSFIGWRLTQYQVEDQDFLVLQVTQTSKNSIFSKVNCFDLKFFLFFRATHALRFYTLSIVGGLQESFLVRFERACLYIIIPVGTPKFSQKLIIFSKRIPVHSNFCIYQTS